MNVFLGGLIVLALGWMIGGYLAKWVYKFFEKKGLDVTVNKFIAGIVKLMSLFLLLLWRSVSLGLRSLP